MTNTAAQTLIRELRENADHLMKSGFLANSHIPALTIVECDPPPDGATPQVQVICREGVTIGMIVMPDNWTDPPDTGRKLAVPPDEDGWALLDELLKAGLQTVRFWAADST